nr:membrane-associated HD superfamily phosphohydrolase [Mucilaginibacter sp. X4EP1]
MTTNTFTYTSKVWLTSILITPMPIFIWLFYGTPARAERSFSESLYIFFVFYLVIVLAELIFSFLTWIAFWLTAHLITMSSIQAKVKFWTIPLSGLCLSAITLLILLFLLGSDSTFLLLAICNCAAVGLSLWCYRSDIIKIEF